MITPILEKLILTGEAKVKIHNHGVSGAGTILVPDGKTIIITQIIWNPFVDVYDSEAQQQLLFNNSDSFLHTLKLRNKQDRYAYTFRDTLKSTPYITAPATGKTSNIFHAERPTVLDTFLKFNGDVQIDIKKAVLYNNWLIDINSMPAQSNEPPMREGYGTTAMPVAQRRPVVLGVDYNPFGFSPTNPTKFNPITQKRGQPTLPQSTEEFELGEALTPPAIAPNFNPLDLDVFNFPIITFTYVELNTRYILDNILKKAF